MPAKGLRCEVPVYVIPEGTLIGEKAVECGAIAVACIDCNGSAGCLQHAFLCANCGRAVCKHCRASHDCQEYPEATLTQICDGKHTPAGTDKKERRER